MRTPRRGRSDTDHPYGTVPYHRARADNYRTLARVNLAAIAFDSVWLVWPLSRWCSPIFCALLVAAGAQLNNARRVIADEEHKAWDIESRATVEGMHEAGIYTLADAVRAIAATPPPRMSRKERERWRAHNEERAAWLEAGGHE